MNILVIVLLVLLIVGGIPTWGYHNYGWTPSGGLGLVLIILLVLALTGRI